MTTSRTPPAVGCALSAICFNCVEEQCQPAPHTHGSAWCTCHLPPTDTHLLQHHGTHLLWCEHAGGVIVRHLDANLIILQGNDFEWQERLNVSLQR